VHYYTFDPVSGVLTDDQNPSVPLVNYPNPTNGLNFGNMVTYSDIPSLASSLACPWDETTICDWQLYFSGEEYFQYSVGSWSVRNTLVVKGSSPPKFITFDSPSLLSYSHDNAVSNSGRDYTGSTVIALYGGDGALMGIPQICIDEDGIIAGCVEGSTKSISDILLSDNNPLTDIRTGLQYYAKATDVQTYYPTVPAATCQAQSLNFDASRMPAIPTAGFLVHPDEYYSYKGWPSNDEFSKKYLNKGNAVVVKGNPIYA